MEQLKRSACGIEAFLKEPGSLTEQPNLKFLAVAGAFMKCDAAF